jgi:hypothetical protein
LFIRTQNLSPPAQPSKPSGISGYGCKVAP